MKLLYAEDEAAAPAQKAALSLSGLAEQALEPFLQPMEAQGITLERDIHPGVSLTADPAQLVQLLSLRLDNAVKSTGNLIVSVAKLTTCMKSSKYYFHCGSSCLFINIYRNSSTVITDSC